MKKHYSSAEPPNWEKIKTDKSSFLSVMSQQLCYVQHGKQLKREGREGIFPEANTAPTHIQTNLHKCLSYYFFFIYGP